jgi:hypothetical protein
MIRAETCKTRSTKVYKLEKTVSFNWLNSNLQIKKKKL